MSGSLSVAGQKLHRQKVEEAAEDGSRTRGAPVKKKKKKTNKEAGIVLKDGKARKIDILKKEMTRLLKKLPVDTFLNMIRFDAVSYTHLTLPTNREV